ncbi:DNA cytosine methyltransferase [Pectobacterium brasiliense]|uniref:DNA cytosine methyltransferase n=1 Tax=Pectobacterium brasiliense TaxID=180957 RepID=UPI000582BDAF|nr:DNA cytosine methyltransferase [Pectobacterium brasiliense]KHS78255.1 DNA methyltransferase [Pectobacterium brasiliense]KHT04110.1 DNA methyltransferase [Pectobacterium brasiliense]MCA6981597.1 DNA cytosine methyltransferase [Pectobacterium brasiliense]MCH4991154.1 DNA cytosine methyltransferase [Pectobacterium brasiliense]
MKNNSEVINKAEKLIEPLVISHVPEGTEPKALVDQWLHAIATDSQFFCNSNISSPATLKEQVLSLLKEQGLYVDREHFFDCVFGALKLKPAKDAKFKFIDLFAGIGGVRLGFQNAGGACVFSSEYDRGAQNTYKINHGEYPFGDITRIDEKQIPEHDILLAGFPCQPFSHAGVSARNAVGKQHGFLCDTQGTLFFDVLRVIKEKKPKVVFLENVRNLETHDQGKTFDTIKRSIEEEGYVFFHKIIDSSSLVPQRRVRCYMIGVREDIDAQFVFPEVSGEPVPLRSVLQKKVDDIYTISDKLWHGHIARTKRNVERGTGFTAYLADLDKPSNTIVARYGKDGKECLIPQVGKNPRMLTPRECARLQGFPEEFEVPVSRTPAYKQFGNSVVVPVINILANKLIMDVL